METENQDALIPEAQQVEPKADKPEPFTKEQQEKVNALIKQERINVLTKLGITSIEEGKEKLASVSELESLREKANKYDEEAQKTKDLTGENAMLKLGIASDMREIVKGYFVGTNKDLTEENLNKLFEEKPTLKSQWLDQPKQTILVGNPKNEEKPKPDGYSEFRKYTKY